MEHPSGSQDGERSRPPPFARAASRSSTSSSKTRTTHLSSNSSYTRLPPSPQQGAAHPTHRFHHNACSTGSSERPRSQLSREASEDSRQSHPPVSNFLQERLQRERQVGSERSTSRLSNETMNASCDPRTAHSSPVRSGASEGRRPRSSGGVDPVKKKQGLGIKEMEQTLSTMHKQNFDLKLELYHRRERQTALEERLEKLETEKIQTDEMNDKLVVELEKRDKAVEEAVAMIVDLEARVEQLLREREMVREIEHQGFFYDRNGTPGRGTDLETPRRANFERRSDREDDAKLLARMPSFLSEHSEATSNLRNVYLGARGSILSLYKLAEDGQGPERESLEGTRSPSLSVLSESSFRSIYGQEDARASRTASPSPPRMEPAPFDGLSENGSLSPNLSSDKSKIVTPSKLRRVESRNMSAGSARFQNINDILDVAGSPLQRLEKLEMTLTAMDDASRPATSYERKDSRPSTGRPVKPSAQPRTKQEKRDALERVLTNGPVSKDYRNTQGLPPTPDTISTSTLRRFKKSNDTLPKENELGGDRSYLALSDMTTSQQSIPHDKATNLGVPANGATRTPSTSVFDALKELSSDATYFNGRFSTAQIPRPRSADETTLSNRRGGRGLADWDSDDSDDGLDGAGSTASTFDYWMRESLSPNRAAALNPFSSASQAGNKQHGRISPDLFSFPTSTSGWATDAMFGTIGGSGHIGSAAGGLPTATPLAQTLDALGDSLPQPLFGSGLASPVLSGAGIPPPPPNRRSSLHARTGSSHGMITGISSSPAGPSPSQTRFRTSPRRSRERGNSIDGPPKSSHNGARSAAAQMGRAPTAPPQSSGPTAPPDAPQQQPKQRHYPPTASQPARSRGLKSLFRRSTGSAADVQQTPPPSAPATETSFKNITAPMVGIPTTLDNRRPDLYNDDDRASATPPPIMRNRRGSVDGGAPLDGGAPVGLTRTHSGEAKQATNDESGGAPVYGAPVKSDGGAKIRWPVFGRNSSLRNRAG